MESNLNTTASKIEEEENKSSITPFAPLAQELSYPFPKTFAVLHAPRKISKSPPPPNPQYHSTTP